MDSINHPAKKRKAVCDPPPTHGHDDPRTALSLADLNRLIDQRVYDAVERKTLALTLRVDDLQRENEALLLRCESLERSVQVLKEEGNWTYSAPDVLESHWIEQGRDDDYADEAESLIQAIADSTHDLRLSGGEKVAVFGGGTPISSDNVLNPHWDELSNAIQLSERVTTLDLKNVQLDQRTLQIIEASARQKGLKGVTLARNQFHGSDGVQFAIDVLKSNRSVEMFSWLPSGFLLLLAKFALAGLQAFNNFSLWQARQAGKQEQLNADKAATDVAVKTGDDIVKQVESMTDQQLNEALSK